MDISGKHLIAGEFIASGTNTFNSYNPAEAKNLDITFHNASDEEVNAACAHANEAFNNFKNSSDLERAKFLETIADEINNLGDLLINTAHQESGLPIARLQGERGRTTGQLNAFAKMLQNGSWVNAIIDTAQPDRQPLPKSDIRQMQIPIGPVAVFGASNFPLAFSVAGGDTASALAAGCPVVFKAHPAHPATCELVAKAIWKAIEVCNLPKGTFSLLQGNVHEVGENLVKNTYIKAVGFTGSFNGGKALFDLANARKEPIPVYAEMGSVNPIFFLPQMLKEKGEVLSKGFANSITLGVGQFCTNPGMFILMDDIEGQEFLQNTKVALEEIKVGPMLTKAIGESYIKGITHLKQTEGVQSLLDNKSELIHPELFLTSAQSIEQTPNLVEEVFGPCSIGVLAKSKSEILKIAKSLKGHLTATIQGTPQDLQEYKELIDILKDKVGRLLVNGFPTGVEVTHAMIHGGPFPATTDSRGTSVGTTAIYRFTRPICFQDFPDDLLPEALKNQNPLNLNRLVNGENTYKSL